MTILSGSIRRMFWLALILVGCIPAGIAADEPAVQARVECVFAERGFFPFSAGKDRCWEAINGKTMVPKAVVACAVKRSSGVLSVTFRFSESPKPDCDTSKVATKEQYTQALPLLGRKEREFFSSHVDVK